MAWNKYYIVVTGQGNVTPEEVLVKLQLTGYRSAGEANFPQTNKSNDFSLDITTIFW